MTTTPEEKADRDRKWAAFNRRWEGCHPAQSPEEFREWCNDFIAVRNTVVLDDPMTNEQFEEFMKGLKRDLIMSRPESPDSIIQ